jgi:hypothetical protein
MKLQDFLIQLIAVLHLPCSVFASTKGPLLSEQPTLRKTLEGGLSVTKIGRQVSVYVCCFLFGLFN